MADVATHTLFLTPEDRAAATKLKEAHRKATTNAPTTSAAVSLNRSIQFDTQSVIEMDPANLEVTLP